MLNYTTIHYIQHVLKYGRIHSSLYGLWQRSKGGVAPWFSMGQTIPSSTPQSSTWICSLIIVENISSWYINSVQFLYVDQVCFHFSPTGGGNWILRHPWLELDLIWFHDVGCKRRLPPSLETRTFRRRAVRPVEHLLVHQHLHLIFYHVFLQTARIDEHSFASATIEL